jgi:ribonuclease P protein component
MAKRFTLGSKERLKSRKQIEQLFKDGKSFVHFPYRIYFQTSNETEKDSALQFGVGVSAKLFKKAVDRNRIKRLTREAWRLQKNELAELVNQKNSRLNVFFIFTGKELPDYKFVFDKIGSGIKKIKDKCGIAKADS